MCILKDKKLKEFFDYLIKKYCKVNTFSKIDITWKYTDSQHIEIIFKIIKKINDGLYIRNRHINYCSYLFNDLSIPLIILNENMTLDEFIDIYGGKIFRTYFKGECIYLKVPDMLEYEIERSIA